MAIPPSSLEQYEKLLATIPSVKRKGAVHPYTSENGHMFTYLDQTGALGIRLPKDVLEAFLKKYKTKLFESYGVVKKRLCHRPRDIVEEHKRTGKIPENQPRIRENPKTQIIRASSWKTQNPT
jgi:hypothetical protein